MQGPEEYNVLHIGPESAFAQDQKIITEAKKARIGKIANRLFVGVLALGIVFYNHSLQGSLEENELKVNSLIDEVGALNQNNFTLQEQISSQDAVLKGIETDFSKLGSALEGGDNQEIAGLFTSILEKFSESDQTALTLSEDVVLSETEDSSLDILILGTNGALTDTIMVANINETKKKVTLISIPRDLYMNGRRINEYYTYYGVETLERMVESVTGLEIDQYVQVDLDGFEQVVDVIGGIDIYVPEAIYDGLYPNGKGGYSAFSIEEGTHHMNGEEALRYARSRKSTSDFDRAGRQQEILSAVKTKIVQMDSVMDMKELMEIFQTGLTYTSTDINVVDLVSYYSDYQDYELSTGFVLSTGNYLYSMINESGAYILLPNSGSFTEIQGVIQDLIN